MIDQLQEEIALDAMTPHDRFQYMLMMPLRDTSVNYYDARWFPTRGWCGIKRMAFTTGLWTGLNGDYTDGRYCFHTWREASAALAQWDGTGDPSGEWIKWKGRGGEYPRVEGEDD